MYLVNNQNKKASTMNKQEKIKKLEELNEETDKLIEDEIMYFRNALRIACVFKNARQFGMDIDVGIEDTNGQKLETNKADFFKDVAVKILTGHFTEILAYSCDKITLEELKEKLNEQ